MRCIVRLLPFSVCQNVGDAKLGLSVVILRKLNEKLTKICVVLVMRLYVV